MLIDQITNKLSQTAPITQQHQDLVKNQLLKWQLSHIGSWSSKCLYNECV